MVGSCFGVDHLVEVMVGDIVNGEVALREGFLHVVVIGVLVSVFLHLGLFFFIGFGFISFARVLLDLSF